jgi:predicted MPP superfamily phosphohydrolase
VVVIRRLFLVALLASTQGFWLTRAWRAARQLPRPWWARAGRIAANLAAVMMVAVLVDRLHYHFLPESVSRRIAPITLLWIFASIVALLFVKAVHGVEWVWNRVARLCARSAEPADQSRRAFFRYAAYVAGAVPFLGAFYGFASERKRYRIEHVEVRIANLPRAFDGLRIAQLSDIHIGDFLPPEELREVVQKVNELKPDLAVITGDLVSGSEDPLAECVQELSRLRAALGVWGCNGNHEIYAGLEDEAEQLFAKHGMKMLRESSVQLERGGAKLNLIGTDYQREYLTTRNQRPMLAAIEAQVRCDMPNILLCHNPNGFYRAAELGIDLTLSGHTHGGQINLEIVNKHLNPARFMTEFIAGMYKLPMKLASREAILYVNRGLGTLACPARVNAEPEITLLTLRA